MRILDTHLHLIDPTRLRYNWLEGDLARRFGVDEVAESLLNDIADERAFVFVQAGADPRDAEAEVSWVTSIADTVNVAGIVAHAPFEDPERTTALLEHYSGEALVVGIRRLIQDEAPGFTTSPEFRRGCEATAARGFTFDACVRSHQLPELIAMVDAVPDLVVVLDHLGKPEIGTANAPVRPDDTDWLRNLQMLAERASVRCKLSGLPAETTTTWNAAQIEPFLDVALEAFGPERLMFGSDWPVSGRNRGEAVRWRRAVADWAVDRLGNDLADDVLWSNAARTYIPPTTKATPPRYERGMETSEASPRKEHRTSEG